MVSHVLLRIITYIGLGVMRCCLSQQKLLYRNLLQTYQKDLRPVIKESSAVNISVQMYFKQVLKVTESDQIITVYCWLEQYWLDEFLTWDPDKYGGIDVLHVPADVIWKPDLLVYNNANMNVKENELHTNAIIRHNGSVSLFRAVITDITCNLDMTYFPFDQQLCFLMLASWTHDGSQLTLHAMDSVLNGGNLAYYIPNMEWSLTDWAYRMNLKYYECCPNAYPDISYYFVLKRNPAYYLMTLILPSAFITIVTVVGFFTPHSSSGENTEKVSLGVTALLSLAIILMMVSDKLPATSKVVPLLGRYYVGLIVIMFAATCATTFILTVQMKGNHGKKLNRTIKSIVEGDFLRYCRRRTGPRQILSRETSIKMSSTQNENSDPTMSLLNHHPNYIPLRRGTCTSVIQQRKGSQPNTIDASIIEKLKNEVFLGPLKDLTNSVTAIKNRLEGEAELDAIRKDWQKLARVLERTFMIIFISITASFAFLMLRDNKEPITITREVMNSIQNNEMYTKIE